MFGWDWPRWPGWPAWCVGLGLGVDGPDCPAWFAWFASSPPPSWLGWPGRPAPLGPALWGRGLPGLQGWLGRPCVASLPVRSGRPGQPRWACLACLLGPAVRAGPSWPGCLVRPWSPARSRPLRDGQARPDLACLACLTWLLGRTAWQGWPHLLLARLALQAGGRVALAQRAGCRRPSCSHEILVSQSGVAYDKTSRLSVDYRV